MTSPLDFALQLAGEGFYVFPLRRNSKLPAIRDFPSRATRDETLIRKWWAEEERNIGVYCGRFGEGKALIAVDVDVKHGKRGDHEIFRLMLDGKELPETLETQTPTGGRHLFYAVDQAVAPGTDVLGQGLDVRSYGSYVVGCGSLLDGRPYLRVNGHEGVAPAPEWVVDACHPKPKPRPQAEAQAPVDPAKAEARALDYLKTAPLAVENSGGDITAFRVAACMKDFGCSESQALELLLDFWNPRCSPPWDEEALAEKVANAYRYGRESVGCSAPEVVFPELPQEEDNRHPFEKLNAEYAFIFAGGTGNVLWETTDASGKYCAHLMNKNSFLDRLAPHKVQVGEKIQPLGQAWFEWPRRRTFDGIVFEPGREMPERWFNMWRGFQVEPAKDSAHPMVDRWKEHLLLNVCRGDSHLADWLTGWFAHLVQRPWEKPLVGVVFKGSKGVGKNALVERVSHLLGPHSMITSRRRYLVSNFTLHLQRSLLFILDEAFWSGDKEAEGVVKDLITGSTHIIEPKGKESYEVRNLTRVVVIGNEEWLVPASHDERRWAVFSVGEGRKQDRPYFEEMRIGLDDEGGGAHLLRYLLDYKIAQDVNQAPETQALLEQKIASLEPQEQWWLECLVTGAIIGGDWAGEWPETVPTNRLRDALSRWARGRNIRSRLPEVIAFGRNLKRVCPGISRSRVGKAGDGDSTYVLAIPSLDYCRKSWAAHYGGGMWEGEE